MKDEIKLFKLTLSENMLDFSSQICELICVGRTIEFYKTAKGKCPVEEFLNSLPGKIVQKITWVLNLIRETEKVPAIYLKKLRGSDDIWECRIQFGSNIYRLFCFFDMGTIIVITHGIVKKSQKTPKKEIKTAEAYKDDYLRRKKNG